MKKILYRAHTRGSLTIDWLKSYYSFSFADYYDHDRMGFGILRVLNDDLIKGGKGFDFHSHQNMEIVTIPLQGALLHKDNLGHSEELIAGQVQVMSAGRGIVHGEWNASIDRDCALLQIWLFPNKQNIEPRYEQKTFTHIDRKGEFQIVVSPDGRNGSLYIQQNAFLYLCDLEPDQSITYALVDSNNLMYIFVVEGQMKVAGEELDNRDAIGLVSVSSISITATQKTSFLIMEIPSH